jgi:dolichol-phosphate mannosyltransferase
MLSVVGSGLLGITVVLMVLQVVLRLVRPDLVPPGLTTVLMAVMFFGSLSVFAIAVLGEYLAKVFEEVKRRPLYIRRSIIREGEVRAAVDERTSGANE